MSRKKKLESEHEWRATAVDGLLRLVCGRSKSMWFAAWRLVMQAGSPAIDRMVCVKNGWCGSSVVGYIANGSRWRWPHVCVARRRVSSGLCRRAPHPRRQNAWVSSGESLFGTSGANRGTKLAQLRGCDSAMARRGRGRGSGSSTLCFTFPTFVKGGKGGKQ